MSDAHPTLWLCRHGETPWTVLGRHTGRTDVALTPRGERQAVALGRRLACRPFALVLTSPLVRARDTCRLAGYGDTAVIEPDLQEWDYGAYEGLTTQEIRVEQPAWTNWKDGAPLGESPTDVGRRADRVIARVRGIDGDGAVFAHGHLLRVLAARWLGLPPSAGALYALDTASVSVMGFEREQRVIHHWNEICHLEEA
ncbi:MAG TPA: histidine phosphatase family protein [Gemmatimonadaceae bacterium]|nr:histidine phosphatase family protein [Gemmatimonadaceae bacterium]